MKLTTPEKACRIIRNRLWYATKYDPHPKQVEVHRALDSGARYVGVNAGTRSGKTIMAAATILEQMSYAPPEKFPVGVIPIIAPFAELTDKCFRWLWKWIVVDRVFGCAPRSKSERERYIEMPWGMRVEGKTADNPDNIIGEGWIFVVIDEYARMRKNIYAQYVRRGLVDCEAAVLAISTPQGKLNHWHERFDDWTEEAKTDPLYFTTTFTSSDNPHLPDGEIAAIEAEMRRLELHDLFRQEYRAEFTALSGAVYPQFQPIRNGQPWHVQDFEINRDIPVSLGIDWGFKNPFACMLSQVTGDDRVLNFDEVYARGLTDPECAKAVTRKLALYGLQPEDVELGYADPSSPEAIEEFEQAGFRMFRAKGDARSRINNVTDGITAVRSLFGREDKPGIIFHPRCENAVKEHGHYQFSERAQDEKPVKQDDHTCDAERYLVMGAIGSYTKPFVFSI